MKPLSFSVHSYLLATVLVLACSAPVRATIFTVGAPGGGCTHTGIQDAINAAGANAGTHTVRITRSQTYTAQQVVMITNKDVNIVGGFATCASTVSDGTQTIVSGAGGDTLPVFDLRAPTGAIIKFRLLRITAGDQDGAGSGGGINYIGTGLLELIETTVDNNDAAYGGGIYFQGDSSLAELRISNDVLVSGNDATISGGGIYFWGGNLTMTAPGSSLAFNEAAQFGGGLMLLGSDGRLSNATVSSGGYAGLAAIEGNEAAQGGGVSVYTNDDSSNAGAYFELRSIDPALPARIASNFASQYGGAIHMQTFRGLSGSNYAYADIFDGELDSNSAPDAAAVLAGTDSHQFHSTGAYFRMTGGRITGHTTRTAGGTVTNGALIVAREAADAELIRVRVDGNDSGPLVHARAARFVKLGDSLVTGNTVRGRLFEVLESNDAFNVVSSTIVDNVFSDGGLVDPAIVHADQGVNLKRMLIWQPGRRTLNAGAPVVDDVLAAEFASLPAGGTYSVDDPRFLDRELGDYRLQAASPAVDFSQLTDGSDFDGNGRGVDIARVADLEGRGDLGAFERLGLGNLVLNPGFATDLRRWSLGTPGASATRVASGAGSTAGSVTLSLQAAPGGVFTGFVQCVRIPGPGAWRLAGQAYGAGGDPFTRDIPTLRWRLIYNTGDETCGGVAAGEGDVSFANAATWSQAETVINVPQGEWTPYTAIEVQLRAREGSININATTTAHFDGIVLEATDLVVDPLFSDGFE